MSSQDQLHRFVFENLDIRGGIVQLNSSWQAILSRYTYPDQVAVQLGQAMAATVLLSATIKFEGSLILQVQGAGPLKTVVTQTSHDRLIRGLARWSGDDVPASGLHDVYGDGRMVLTIDNKIGKRYQGIVALEGDHLGKALEGYFMQSEQLASRIWLAADGERAAGLFIQELPTSQSTDEDWNRIGLLADTVRSNELLETDAKTLLTHLFHEEGVRLFEPEPVAFRCGCSNERIETTLQGLGYDEVKSILEEQGVVNIACDFCNKEYRYDSVDVEKLFADQPPMETPKQTQ